MRRLRQRKPGGAGSLGVLTKRSTGPRKPLNLLTEGVSGESHVEAKNERQNVIQITDVGVQTIDLSHGASYRKA